MTQILPSASYVRNPAAVRNQGSQNAILASISERVHLDSEQASQVWELLQTPQTVETLRRSLASDEALDNERITSLLATLYDQDLIQVSPDT
jgi:hypothetical protein